MFKSIDINQDTDTQHNKQQHKRQQFATNEQVSDNWDNNFRGIF